MSQTEWKSRREVPAELTWDLTAIFADRTAFEAAVVEMKKRVEAFVSAYEGRLKEAATISAALADYEDIMQLVSLTNHYSFMPETTDITDAENTSLSRRMNNLFALISAQLTFFDAELTEAADDLLDQVAEEEPRYRSFIRHIKAQKKIRLAPEAEKALAHLAPALNAPQNIYEQARLADMDFGTFEVNGTEYPLSFVLYEDYYMYHEDTAVRRAAFDKFSAVLAQYQNVVATAYYTQVQKEKTMATLRGFDSVFDYLLYGQEVGRDLYDRQIDLIMTELAPVMRKYITHLKEVAGLDKMTYADLKIDLDREYTPKVTIEESKELIRQAISVLGESYSERIMKAYPERWVDFAQNKGKSTGGFCTAPYGRHPYILMSWTSQLSNVYTLIHEFGHAGQMSLSNENNSVLGSDPSLYIVEAPSTFNELLLTDSLTRSTSDKRMERFALTKMFADTYFHNFVTHLLEAAYQREVYQLVDEGKSFDAQTLSRIKRSVLEQFWGEAVEINPGAELTWMRQVHYYMGLYSYTYSAGLTVATQAFLNIKREGQPAVDRWLHFLALGDQLTPVEAAKAAGVDVTTDQPLRDTIHYLDTSVDRLIELSEALDQLQQ